MFLVTYILQIDKVDQICNSSIPLLCPVKYICSMFLENLHIQYCLRTGFYFDDG